MFDNIKTTFAKDVALTYQDDSNEFEIYTDALSKQVDALIIQGNGPLSFFVGKLTEMHQSYRVTEIEILAIAGTLNEFKGMLWGQLIKV